MPHVGTLQRHRSQILYFLVPEAFRIMLVMIISFEMSFAQKSNVARIFTLDAIAAV